MKITCEGCRAQYDIDDAKIPAGGFKMTCPACQSSITLTAAQVVAGKQPQSAGISLSIFDEGSSPEPSLDLDAPDASNADAMPAIALADETDFSSLGTPSGKPLALDPPRPLVLDAPLALDPPAPRGASLALDPPELDLDEEPDLPAPRVAKGPPALPTAPSKKAEEFVDLPTPRVRTSEAPRRADVDGGVDLPAPKAARPPVPAARPPAIPAAPVAEEADLPAPKAARGAPQPVAKQPVSEDVDIDLLVPKAGGRAVAVEPPTDGLSFDLDAPDVDDQPGATSLSHADLPQPKGDAGVDVVAPRASGSGKVPAITKEPEVTAEPAVAPQPQLAATAVTIPRQGSGDAADEEEDDDAAAKKKRKRLLVFGGAGLAAVGAITAAVLVLTDGSSAARREVEQKSIAARKAFSDDTLAAFKKTAADLKPYSSGEKPIEKAAIIEATARLSMARLGVTAELANAKALLDRPSKEPSLDRDRADALRALASGDVATARTKLKALIGGSTADAQALAYLGATEILGHDLAAADAAFTRALAVEPARAQALYGHGLVAERNGDDKAARAAYDKVIAAAADHARAQLGVLRIQSRAGDAAAAGKIEAFVTTRAASLAPRELAEAFVALGRIASDSGRVDEAEERFKKALALDGDVAQSYVAFDARLGISRARIDLGRGKETWEDLRKLVTTDAKGVEARLLLAEALVANRDQTEAEGLLGAVEKLRPKEPRLPLLRGRLLLARNVPTTASDREEAVKLFREATSEDPKLLSAWGMLARTLHELGRTEEAVDVLGKAADALSGDPRGAASLGAAYLAIGRSADAEARFRAVLATAEGKPAGAEQLPLWLGLGEALEQQGKLAEAQDAYASARKLSPDSPQLIEHTARLAIMQNKIDEARALYADALKLGAPTVGLRVGAAELDWKSGHEDDARKLLDGILKDDDRSAPATLLLAKIDLASGHVDEALVLARRAAVLQDLPDAHLVLGQALEQSNKLEPALAEYNLARHGATQDQAALGHGRVLVRMEATRDALVDLEPLVKASSVRAEALVLEGDCYTDLQQSDKARKAFEDATKAAPTLGEAAFKYGRALIDAGKRKPGLDSLERAVKLADKKTTWLPDAYLMMGDAHRLAKESQAAVEAYAKYLEIAPPSAPQREEAVRQVQLLGGKPSAP